MKINIVYVLLFALGLVAQAFFMLAGQWKKGDGRKLLISLATGLLGLLPGKREDNYDLGAHIFFSCIVAAFSFTGAFRKRLLTFVGARSLIILNILMIYLIYNKFEFSYYLLYIAFIPTVITLLNGFVDIDKVFGWQVFFYVWFSIMIVVIGLMHFAFSDLLEVFGWGNTGQYIAYWSVFLVGASFMYIFSSAWYVAELIPYTEKHQTMSARMKEIRQHMQLLAYGYLWENKNFSLNLAVLLIVPAILLLNRWLGLLSDSVVISLALASLPFFSRQPSAASASGDGIGDISACKE